MARTYRLGFLRRLANAVIRRALRAGFGPPRTWLLIVPGRSTGRLYDTPVTLVEDDGRRWLVAPYGEVGWVRNVRAAGHITLRRGRRSERLRAIELPSPEAAPVLQRYARQVPITRPYFDAPHDAPLTAFEAEAPRHPVFRLVADSDGARETRDRT